MEKLVVMIPAYNEEDTIATVIQEIPRKISGVKQVEVLLIDDGSRDRTSEIAQHAGADHIIHQTSNKGLAHAFKTGLDAALQLGADIIVNTDADNQYDQKEIAKLIQPILVKEAEIVLGDRQIEQLDHMIWAKRYGNMIGSYCIRKLSGLNVSDSQTGFRAFSREAALRINVISDYTYTQETIIQAASKKLAVVELPCSFKARDGHSKLISSVPSYIKRAGATILRTYTRYKPLKVFVALGSFFFLAGLGFGIRFLIRYFTVGAAGHIQSLILAAVLMIIGFQVIVFGVLADLIDNNRKLNEELLYQLKRQQLGKDSTFDGISRKPVAAVLPESWVGAKTADESKEVAKFRDGN